LLKATALVALISVSDLMFEAKQINGSTFLSAEAFGTALLLYYVMARLAITPGMRWLERVMARRLGRV
jgi:polar amino acid transport system permease protein